jgi:hypothetical protein
LLSLSFSPSDIHSFVLQLVAFSFFQILKIHFILYRQATMKSFFSSLAGCVTFLSLLASTQAASNSTNGLSCGVAKPDDSYFSVIGVQGTGVHPRQELRELEKDTELWNIFLQAFTRFQGMSQDEKISYYQIAGKARFRVYKLTQLITYRYTWRTVPEVGQRSWDAGS